MPFIRRTVHVVQVKNRDSHGVPQHSYCVL